jgi:hypothetical protein
MTPKLDQQVKSWATPQQRDFKDPESVRPTPEAYVVRGPIPTEFVDGKFVSLHGEVKYGAKIADAVRVMEEQVKGDNWATPRSRDAGDWMMNKERLATGKPEDTLTGQATQSNKSNGKLNPRWVETLMGLPVGWTMPSCASPITPMGNTTQSMGENWITPQSGDVTGSTEAAVEMWSKGQRPKTSDQRLRTQVAAMERRIKNSASPVTIAPTNCACSATELSQQPQP